MEIKATPVFGKLDQAIKKHTRGIVLEGGSRSSKTYSIIQAAIVYAQEYSESTQTKRWIIARKKATWISSTVLYDFIDVLKTYGIYDTKYCKHNKSKNIVKIHNTEFWFAGLDDTQKLHGMKSDVFWINEAIEVTKDDVDQLEQRCNQFFLLDYNPSEEEHWIYDNILKRDDVSYIHSTMLNNPFIGKHERDKILSYEPTEHNYIKGTADKRKWEIYGLGKRAKIEGLVFENYEIVKEIPIWVNKIYTGMDFGFTHDPTAIIDVGIDISKNSLYIDQQCYATNMLSTDIIRELKQKCPDKKTISESADPRLIEEIYRAGVDIHAVEKFHGSVIAGIDKMRSMKIYITERSVNTIKEFKNYLWQQDKNGKYLNKPIDDFNHSIDAVRYVVLTQLLGKTGKKTDKNIGRYFF